MSHPSTLSRISPCRVTLLRPHPAGPVSVRQRSAQAVHTQSLQDCASDFLKQVSALYAEGRPLAAAVPLRRAILVAPENAVGHYLLGLAYKALGRHEAASAEWHVAAGLPKTESGDDWVRGMARKLLAKHSPPQSCFHRKEEKAIAPRTDKEKGK